MKTYNDYAQLAHDNNLKCGHVTGGRNGYPTPYLGAFINGFNTFEEAEKFAEKHNGEIRVSKARDGWSVVELAGYRTEAFDARCYVKDLGDDYSLVNSLKEYINEVECTTEAIRESINEDDHEEYASVLDNALKNIVHVAKTVDFEKYSLAIGNGSYEEVRKTMMSYHEDVWGWSIGVFFDRYSQEEEETE